MNAASKPRDPCRRSATSAWGTPLPTRTAALLLCAALAACSHSRRLPGDDAPTLASLAEREQPLAPDPALAVTEAQTIAAYRDFLAAAPKAPQRAQALRRLGDLQMDLADRQAAESSAAAAAVPDYRSAIAQYRDYLKAYPDDPRNDGVRYQLARAQEQAGDLEAGQQTLTELVARHPDTVHRDEAQFRRGELLFALRRYAPAEEAYAAVLATAPAETAGQPSAPLAQRALYMQGWARFKQGRLEDALQAFFGVLDARFAALPAAATDEPDLAAIDGLARADRELLEDTFRVVGISLSNLQGAASVAPFVTTPLRESYQFRIYQHLGELYIRQDRVKDAADTLTAFVRRQPLHPQAPRLQARAVAILDQAGFQTLALQAKREHVERYGAASPLRTAQPAAWQQAQPLVHDHLEQLARWHHARAQQSHAVADVDEAVGWYRRLLEAFPDDADAPQSRFMLAELLYENRRWADAAAEYETVAYGAARVGAMAGRHPQAADAGYAALLSYAAQEPTIEVASRPALQATAIASAERFAEAFPTDARGGPVLVHAAEQLYAQGQGERAAAVARQALARVPPPAAEARRTAWTVVAHQAFDAGAHAQAEQAYAEALALWPQGPATASQRADMRERLAASIYRQGETARAAGQAREAVTHFQRVAALSGLGGSSAVRASAQFDAAAALIGLKDWSAAARALEDFRRQHPGHPLQAEVAPKLALAYLELKQPADAAAEFERVAEQASGAEAAVAQSARWQAAVLLDEALASAAAGSGASPALRTRSQKAWERYASLHAEPLEAALRARLRLAALARENGQAARATAWLKELVRLDAAAGPSRTARTRSLAGEASLALAEPLWEAYRQVPLVEPLNKQLKLKKARMEELLAAYAAAAELGVAEAGTAATERTAALYQDFGRALLASARPKKLNKAEREQYDVMLEEQAFPFEERAIALHEANARRAAEGLWDAHVQRSYAALAQLKPGRWGKTERGDERLPQDVAALEVALKAQPDRPALLNQLGIAQRRQGRFDAARQAYEAAIAQDPNAAEPELNLAILHDLYRGDATQALAHYQRFQALAPAAVPQLGKWLAELKSRKPTEGAPATAATAAAAVGATAAGSTGNRKETP